jgi:uncharacterized protein (DUF58 family)
VDDYVKYLDPKTLNKISHLDLKARLIVEGYVAGLHKSPFHGFSVEFAEHREYVPGDDIKHIDWKVFGKSDRYYIKQYEEETNLVAYIALDTSESMSYGSEAVTKAEYASYVAASLVFLILQQQDAVGLALFDHEVRTFLPPASHSAHMKNLIQEIANSKPREKEKTDVGTTLHRLADRITKRGLIVLISDLLDKPENVLRGLRHLRHKRHDVIVFHVLDHDEVTFPFERMTQFEGLEGLPNLIANPRALRKAYLAAFDEYTQELRRGCLANNVDYVLLDTSTTLDVALSSYLATRAGTRKGTRR